jgi:hypothetical protein
VAADRKCLTAFPGINAMNSFLKKSYSGILSKVVNMWSPGRRACSSEVDGRVVVAGDMDRHHLTRDRGDKLIKAAISGNLKIKFKE